MEVPLPNGMEEKEHILALPSYANKKVVTKNRCTPHFVLLKDMTEQIPTAYPGVKVFTQQVTR